MALTGIPSRVVDFITKKLGIQTAIENSQFDLSPMIQPIIDINEKTSDIVEVRVDATASGGNFFTAATGKRRTFLTGCYIALDKDATSDLTVVRIYATVKGRLRSLMRIDMLSTTAQNRELAINFKDPVEIDKGTTVYVNLTGGSAGNHLISSGVYGYTEDN